MTDLRNQLQRALGTAYAVERELGGGGMSRVFVAMENALRRRVVIKVLTPELAQGLSADRFAREIQLAAGLQDPHIVPVISTGVADGVPYFTMPYVEGESLRARLLRGPVPYAEALGILRDVALALEYAHARGVVHRDIKPENVLLAGRTAVVADFGIAKAVSAARTHAPGAASGTLTSIGQSLGTPAYMAPEQAAGDPVDHRADLYAWGVMAYELLAGRHPFANKATAAQLMAAHVTEAPADLAARQPGIAPPVAALVMQCLAKEPDARPQTASDVVHALDATASPSGATTSSAPRATPLPPTAPANVTPSAQSARALPALPIAVGVVALAVGAVFMATRTKGDTAKSTDATATAPAPASSRSIAVLPFEHLGDTADAYFTEGITDAVRGKLMGVEGMQVIARASSIQYPPRQKTPAAIAKELGVRYLLTGTVRFAGTGAARRVQVSPELVEVVDGAQPQGRWQQPFDAEVKDVFKVQGEIAGQVVAAMQVALGDATRQRLQQAPTKDPVAYDYFLRGEAAWNSGNRVDPATLRRAVSFYQQAVARDSNMVTAWGALSRASSLLAGNGATSEKFERSKMALAAARRALALDPDGAVGHRAMAQYHSSAKRDFRSALEELEFARKAAPSDPGILITMGGTHASLGHPEDAVRALREALSSDPRSASAWSALAIELLRSHRSEEARETIRRARELDPEAFDIQQGAVIAELQLGDLEAARRTLRTLRPAGSDRTSLVAYMALYYDLGWVLEADDERLLLTLGPESFDDDRPSWALVRAQQFHWRGEEPQARVWGDSAARLFTKALELAPQDAQLHSLLALSLAHAGRAREADVAAQRSLALGAEDVINRPYYLYLQARARLLGGNTAGAIDDLEQVVSLPYYVTRRWLTIDPTWKSLKGNPRFEKLTAAN